MKTIIKAIVIIMASLLMSCNKFNTVVEKTEIPCSRYDNYKYVHIKNTSTNKKVNVTIEISSFKYDEKDKKETIDEIDTSVNILYPGQHLNRCNGDYYSTRIEYKVVGEIVLDN